ncbi:MAG: response regulator transcription factor [Chloroflexi bacterium]|nr:response regulator transcription factor [Chloroflexota bacterium]
MEQLQVLIADDSEFMRVAYRRILESESSLEIVGMATNGQEAAQKAAETCPDVAILDVRMPKLDGIQAAHEIRRRNPDTSIVVISAYDDLAFVADLMRNGVENKAYLLKHSLSEINGLVRVVEAVHNGQTVLDAGIVQRMARLFCKHSDLLDSSLCGEEQDILGLMAAGYSDDGICATLHLDQANAADHTHSIFEKLGLLGGTALDRRIMAIQEFVRQIHKVPLSLAYDAAA